MVTIKIKIKKKDLWILSTVFVFLFVIGLAISYGDYLTGNPNPNVLGHTSDEINVKNKLGNEVDLQNYIDNLQSSSVDLIVVEAEDTVGNSVRATCPTNYKAVGAGAQKLSTYGCSTDRITQFYPEKNGVDYYNQWYLAWRCVHPKIYLFCIKY